MKRETKIRDAYKASKNVYDDALTQKKLWSKFYIRFFWGMDDLDVSRRVLDAIPSDFSGKLLDVPVGTGVFTCETYKRLPHARVTALDYSEDMLAQAKARFAGNGLANVSCEQGDVGALPYGDAAFDIVLSMNGLHAFPDKDAAFSETARVLAPGGLFIGCTYICGERGRSDFVVKRILQPRGWFTPPFQTKRGLIEILKRHYAEVDVRNLQAIAHFRCVK
ncbi:MAG: class I SAM-dependent methyltransferase [Clostridiales Family XIII bacterium]|jgi:ubiquinone/menaquinone biosynthesis C-methylase UbiE|nr:class I SAM-dependent methyltransferase [Clostridiales Family XIII bacterium]